MSFRNIKTEDVAFINGCIVRRSDTKDVTEIVLSSGNYLYFSRKKNQLVIKKLQYVGRENLDSLFKALIRIGTYTRSVNITCDNDLPTEQIIILDNIGILDLDLDIEQRHPPS